MQTPYFPRRGDVVWLSFDVPSGHEQAGHRPALVVSHETYNKKTGLALFCPITSNRKGYPFEVEIEPDSKISGVILADHVKNLDWKARKAKFCCMASARTIRNVTQKVGLLIF